MLELLRKLLPHLPSGETTPASGPGPRGRRRSRARKRKADLVRRVKELHRDHRKHVEAERLKDEFFANVSHELRTPLTLLLAPLESMLADTYGPVPAEQRAVLQTVHNNATRLLQMVTGLLDFSRLEAAKVEVRREAVDVVALTRAVLADFEPMLRRKGLNSALEADPPRAVVEVDRYLYERILFNLLSNAVKFTPEGSVSVRLHAGADRLRLSVEDTGIGIAEEDLKFLFQKFQQLERTSIRRYEGTGLGLALVKQFAEQLGGSVEVKSTLGEGTTFIVTLTAPMIAEETTADAPVRTAGVIQKYDASVPRVRPGSTAPPEGRPRVVVAEDNTELAAYIIDLLQDFCDVRYARDGAEALALIRAEAPDLVLCDVMMPVQGGLSVCRALKADPATAALPFVVLTALTDREALLEGWEAGVDEYLFKPFHPTELVTRIRTLLASVEVRKQAEAQIRKRERQLRELFESSPDAVFVTNLEGKVLEVNAAACGLHAMDRSALIGRNVRELVPPHRRTPGMRDFKKLLSGALSYIDGYSWTQDGRAVPVEIRANRITYAGQEGMLLQVRDVTHRKEAEEEIRRLNAELEQRVRERTAELEVKNRQLRREVAERKQLEVAARRAQTAAEAASRAKSTFLANMSHEIRTPLTGIMGFASLLAKEVSGEHREFAQLIERSGRRLMDTLNSVLTLAKLEAEQVEVQLDLLKIAEEVSEIVQLSQPIAEEKGLTLAFSVAPGAEAVRVRLDRGALSSILYNLIGNAVKFTDDGRIEVKVEAAAGAVNLHVQDTGVGIDAQFIPHLFDAFRQESSGLSRSHEGSGLGLAITERLVKLMGGRISVKSEKGKGSVFTVSFPIVEEEAREAAPVPDAAGQVPALPLRAQMLVVEDNPDSAYLMEHVLRPLCQVTLVHDAEEALRAAQETAFDIILMDINLGEGPNGGDVLRRLRSTAPAYQDIPIVALTAYALPGDREHFLEMGFNTYLSKPFNVEELLKLVTSLLPSRPAVEENVGGYQEPEDRRP